MSILFSRRCEYALQAICYLMIQPDGKKVSIRELARKLKIPYHFLAKIFQELVYKNILISQKGPYGGFSLALPPRKISLYHIVKAVDGEDLTSRCVMGLHRCSEKNPCPVHDEWGKIRERIYSMLASKSVAELTKILR